MPFRVTQQHRDELVRDGGTVLRGLLPTTLLTDLRRATADAAQIGYRAQGQHAQRLQPVTQYAGLDQQPFRDFAQLPELQQAIRDLLSPHHWHGSSNLGVLIEPTAAHATTWHRDGFGSYDEDTYFRDAVDHDLFWQCNCALYPDRALWVVPRSHARRNTAAEAVHAASRTRHQEGTWEELVAYAAGMPGAVAVELGPGDYALYRASQWHVGIYSPHVKRATLHDHVDTDASIAWRKRCAEMWRAKAG